MLESMIPYVPYMPLGAYSIGEYYRQFGRNKDKEIQ